MTWLTSAEAHLWSRMTVRRPPPLDRDRPPVPGAASGRRRARRWPGRCSTTSASCSPGCARPVACWPRSSVRARSGSGSTTSTKRSAPIWRRRPDAAPGDDRPDPRRRPGRRRPRRRRRHLTPSHPSASLHRSAWCGASPHETLRCVGMTVDVQLNPAQSVWPELREMALAAEAAGYGAVWVYDHLAGASIGRRHDARDVQLPGRPRRVARRPSSSGRSSSTSTTARRACSPSPQHRSWRSAAARCTSGWGPGRHRPAAGRPRCTPSGSRSSRRSRGATLTSARSSTSSTASTTRTARPSWRRSRCRCRAHRHRRRQLGGPRHGGRGAGRRHQRRMGGPASRRAPGGGGGGAW